MLMMGSNFRLKVELALALVADEFPVEVKKLI